MRKQTDAERVLRLMVRAARASEASDLSWRKGRSAGEALRVAWSPATSPEPEHLEMAVEWRKWKRARAAWLRDVLAAQALAGSNVFVVAGWKLFNRTGVER